MGAQRRDSRPKVACLEELLSKIRNGTSFGIGNEEIKGNFVSLFGGVVEWMSDKGRGGNVDVLSRRLT